MKKIILVDGMKCENCAKHVREALLGVNGVISADVNLADKFVKIEADCNVSNESIKSAVNTEKYKVVGIESL